MTAGQQTARKSLGELFVNDFALKTVAVKARQLVHRPEFWDCDSEDIKQDLLLYLIQKASGYDESRATINTFINRVVESAAAELVRSKSRLKRFPADKLGYMQSFETPVDTVDETYANLGSELSADDAARRTCGEARDAIRQIDRHDAIAAAIDAMPNELRTLAQYLKNHTATEAREKFGYSRRRINQMRLVIATTLERFNVGKANYFGR